MTSIDFPMINQAPAILIGILKQSYKYKHNEVACWVFKV